MAPTLPSIILTDSAAPKVFSITPEEQPSFVRAYVCVVCREQKTLFRLRPQKIYACRACIDEHGGQASLLHVLRKVPE